MWAENRLEHGRMNELIILLTVCLIALLVYVSFYIGYVKGMKEIIDMDNEYDYKFKKLITDFVTEKYERRTGEESEE